MQTSVRRSSQPQVDAYGSVAKVKINQLSDYMNDEYKRQIDTLKTQDRSVAPKGKKKSVDGQKPSNLPYGIKRQVLTKESHAGTDYPSNLTSVVEKKIRERGMTDLKPEQVRQLVVNSSTYDNEIRSTRQEQDALIGRLAVDKNRALEDATIDYDMTMQERSKEGEFVPMRQARATQKDTKVGDYTLDPIDEEDMEKSIRQKPNKEFVNDQMTKEAHRQAMLLDLQNQNFIKDEEQHKEAPAVCKGSEKMMKKKQRGQIHQRLFEMGQRKHEDKVAAMLDESTNSEKEENETSVIAKPVINERSKKLQREGGIVDRLLQDADMRKARQENRERIEARNQKDLKKSKTNNKSQKVNEKLFDREYLRAIRTEEIDHNGSVNYIKFGNVLTAMKMIEDREENEDVIFDAWKTLAEQSSSEINEKALRSFCQTVNQSGYKPSNDSLVKKLGLWRSTNMQVKGDKKQIVGSKNWHEKPLPKSYHPKISAVSTEMDRKRKGKSPDLPRFEVLIQRGRMYKDKREQQALEKKEQEVLSFKPDLSKSKSSMKPNLGSRKTSVKKETEITLKMRERMSKDGDLQDFLKEQERKEKPKQYKRKQFAPQLNEKKKPKKPAPVDTQEPVQTEDVDLEKRRLQDAEEDLDLEYPYNPLPSRESILKKTIEGERFIDVASSPDPQEIPEIQDIPEAPTTDENRSKNEVISVKESPREDTEGEDDQSEEQVALLYVDVNLGQGGQRRIVLYEGDKPEDVAHEFAQENELDEEMEMKLKDLLTNQIQNMLTKIEEDDEGE